MRRLCVGFALQARSKGFDHRVLPDSNFQSTKIERITAALALALAHRVGMNFVERPASPRARAPRLAQKPLETCSKAYLADRENRRVQMFTNDGKFIKQLIRTRTPFARNLALSADSHQQFLYVGADKGITVVDRKTLDVVGAIQPAGILGPGHHIATDSKGNIYLAQTTAGMQKLVFKGMPPTQ
jgi:hypothetical protein